MGTQFLVQPKMFSSFKQIDIKIRKQRERQNCGAYAHLCAFVSAILRIFCIQQGQSCPEKQLIYWDSSSTFEKPAKSWHPFCFKGKKPSVIKIEEHEKRIILQYKRPNVTCFRVL